MLSTGTIIGNRYRVVRALGGGGMKVVYLAEDRRLADRRCALAEMLDNFTDPIEQQIAVAAFQREAEVLSQLDHENIVRVYDRLDEGNRHYLVMELVQGKTLEQKLNTAKHKRLEESTVIDVAEQILEALEYLHNQTPPVVYRDLKPANVMIRPNGHVKLIDFGIARIFTPSKTATTVGTEGYAPPEQYEGKAEPRSDLYALGVTMFQLLTGWNPTEHPPFAFPPIQSLQADLDPALASLISDALVLDATRRIGTATEFRSRLQGIARDSTGSHQPTHVSQACVSETAATIKNLSTRTCPNCRRIFADALCPFCKTEIGSSIGAGDTIRSYRPLLIDDRMAQRMVACGWIAAATAGSTTLIFALTSSYGLNHYNLVDAALLLAFAYGISKRSRICAVLALAYHILNRVILLQNSELPPVATVFTLIFGALYVMGVIGTFVLNARRPATT